MSTSVASKSLMLRKACAVRELASLGADVTDAAVLLNASYSYVYKLAKSAGCRLARTRRTSMRDRVLGLRQQGLAYTQISERLGISVGSARVQACIARQRRAATAGHHNPQFIATEGRAS
jgi:uncharacterized protein YerC